MHTFLPSDASRWDAIVASLRGRNDRSNPAVAEPAKSGLLRFARNDGNRQSVKKYEEQSDEYDTAKNARAERRHIFRKDFFWFVFLVTKK